MVSRKRPRRLWGFLPTKSEAQRLALVFSAVGMWLDARCNPDPRTAAVASMAVAGAETDVHVAERLEAMNARLERVERALPRSDRKGTERNHASPAPAPEAKGLTGWLSRWLGHRDRR